ncbi:MAG: monovalent cation/H(+) antiporter subunit G [Rickettsiales bacterium]
MEIFAILGAALALIGTVFMLVGVVGMWRFPDFYARIHAAGVSDGLGLPLVLLGAVIMSGFSLLSLKLLILGALLLVAGPTATHALAGAAYRRDVAEENNI